MYRLELEPWFLQLAELNPSIESPEAWRTSTALLSTARFSEGLSLHLRSTRDSNVQFEVESPVMDRR